MDDFLIGSSGWLNCPHAHEVWICISHDHKSDMSHIHYKLAGDESTLRWGEETGQMNSTCRGEGEGLNCKTRRQRSCVLKACRHKRCFRGICTLGTGSGRGMLRIRECKTASSPRVQSDSRKSSQLRGYRSVGTVAQNQRTHKHINVTNRNEAEINQAGLQ